MTRNIGRRTFILSAVASAFSLYVGGWWAFKVRKNDATDIILAILHKRLGYLRLDESGLVRFAHDYQGRIPEKGAYLASWAGLLRPIYALFNPFELTPKAESFRQFEDHILTQFLLSSDFFQHNADETRIVRYLGYYDPYERLCENPFASLI